MTQRSGNATGTARIWLRATPLVAALALGGCIGIGGGNKPPMRLLRFTSAQTAPAGSALSGNATDAIIVFDPETDRRLAVTRVAVQVDATNVAYLKDTAWVDRPAHLFSMLLTETIRAGGKHMAFSSDSGVVAVGSRLHGDLLDCGYDARERAVVVRYDAVWTAPGGKVMTKRFEAKVAGVAPKPDKIAPALNKAANDVAAQVAEWLG
mgnify:CR=1 FL=1